MNQPHTTHLSFRLRLLFWLALLIGVATLAVPSALAHSGKIHEFAVPTADSGPFGITAGPDGNLWFTEAAGNQIGQLH